MSTHFCDDTVTKEEEVLVPREDLTVPCEALERYKESGFLLDEDKMKGVDRGEPTAPCYVYKPASLKMQKVQETSRRKCCPGWEGKLCDQTMCSLPCKNGGSCIAPNKCTCPYGFKGHQCERNVIGKNVCL
ncbi:protein shifted-like [Asterias rubens]|uniref:protein shifted-like n=1 Tax=Asterias rubens TaxID=7604 RepID=UPI0014557713|nr:protein shifted-like [Asterias rubens]